MRIRKTKLLYAVLLAAMLPGVRAANLETKSGRYLEDYTIIKQSGLTVTVRHMDGETKIPPADLPDDIAAPYIQKAIEREAEAARQGKNPAKRIQRLKQLAEQLPAVKAQIDALIAKLPQEEQTGTAKLPKSETPEESRSGGQTAESGKDQASGLARGEALPKQSPINACQQDAPLDKAPPSASSNAQEAPDREEQARQLKEVWEKQGIGG